MHSAPPAGTNTHAQPSGVEPCEAQVDPYPLFPQLPELVLAHVPPPEAVPPVHAQVLTRKGGKGERRRGEGRRCARRCTYISANSRTNTRACACRNTVITPQVGLQHWRKRELSEGVQDIPVQTWPFNVNPTLHAVQSSTPSTSQGVLSHGRDIWHVRNGSWLLLGLDVSPLLPRYLLRVLRIRPPHRRPPLPAVGATRHGDHGEHCGVSGMYLMQAVVMGPKTWVTRRRCGCCKVTPPGGEYVRAAQADPDDQPTMVRMELAASSSSA